MLGKPPKWCEWYIKDKTSNKILQCYSKQFKEKALESNYLPTGCRGWMLQAREQQNINFLATHGSRWVLIAESSLWWVIHLLVLSCPAIVTMGPLWQLWDQVYGGSSAQRHVPGTRCPGRQAKALFCFWAAPESCYPDLPCQKERWNLSLIQTEL